MRSKARRGVLYRVDCDGAVTILEDGIGIPNTLAWSPDLKRFYFADSLRGQIYVYNFDVLAGEISNKRLYFEDTDLGIPDGSAMDIDGCLWNARWDGSVILRITPSGTIDRVVQLPVPRPTSCIFGGRNLDTLYVTSARHGLSPSQLEPHPFSGCVFAVSGVGQGMPVSPMHHHACAKDLPNVRGEQTD